MKSLFAWVGYSQKNIDYEMNLRFTGKTKWNYWKLWYFFISKTLLFGDLVRGYPALMVTILFLGEVQLFILIGVIGKYLGRIFSEFKKGPSIL